MEGEEMEDFEKEIESEIKSELEKMYKLIYEFAQKIYRAGGRHGVAKMKSDILEFQKQKKAEAAKQ